MVVLLSSFWHGEYGFTYRELMLFQGMGLDFKNKIMLYCFRKVKCRHIRYFYDFFDFRIFTTPHQGLISGFNFIYTPMFLHHFHFISNPISILFFVSFSSTRLLSLSSIFTIFPVHEAGLGPQIFVHLQSGQHPFQFGLELIKKRLSRATSYTSHFDVIFILFLTPCLPRFCLVFRSIFTTVIHREFYGIFTSPFSVQNLVFLLPPIFFIRTLKTICKGNSYVPFS